MFSRDIDLKRVMLYGGLSDSEYTEVLPDIEEQNRQILLMASLLAVVLIGCMFVISLFVGEFTGATVVYGVGCLVSVLVWLLTCFVVPRRLVLTHLLTAVCVEVYLVYGIFVSGVVNTEFPAVTFVVMVVFMSLLFIKRPVFLILQVFLSCAFYSVLICFTKSDSTIRLDLVNVLIFWLLACMWGSVSTCQRMRAAYVHKKLFEFNEVDQLTRLKNRNCYELNLGGYASMYRKRICCVYVDVNGLHQLNNSKGHEAGDEMLKFTADRVIRYFGFEHAYRVGGDEYVVFVLDTATETVSGYVADMIAEVEEAGYSLSVGISHTDGVCKIKDLVREAESKMFRAKDAYYKRVGTTR